VSPREPPPGRDRYGFFAHIATRWMDNDVYGHVNNTVYYAFFDTVINRYLIEEGGLDIHRGPVIGLAVETACTFAGSIQFPEEVCAGLRVVKLGRTSVGYEVGVFAADDPVARAHGRFTHVFVDRETRRPTELPARLREALGRLLTA
jgi:acyl-CoA thioester hydrolase